MLQLLRHLTALPDITVLAALVSVREVAIVVVMAHAMMGLPELAHVAATQGIQEPTVLPIIQILMATELMMVQITVRW
jgi:hypothetical protein